MVDDNNNLFDWRTSRLFSGSNLASAYHPTQGQADLFFESFVQTLTNTHPEGHTQFDPYLSQVIADPRFMKLVDQHYTGIPPYARTQADQDMHERLRDMHQEVSDRVNCTIENPVAIRQADGFFETLSTLDDTDVGGVQRQLRSMGVLPSTAAPQAEFTEHTVERDESLWKIVKDHYGLTDPADIQRVVEHVAHYNEKEGLDANRLGIGETIKLPNSPTAPEGTPHLDWAALDRDSGRLAGRFDNAVADSVPIAPQREFVAPAVEQSELQPAFTNRAQVLTA